MDGCRSGWVAAIFENSLFKRFETYPVFDVLWKEHGDAECICVDIPVGLAGSGQKQRQCDVAARKILGRPRASSVFSPPCREALHAPSFRVAGDINLANTGKKISLQTWNIINKIRQVDDLLQKSENSTREKIIETHPEVCFRAFDKRPMYYNKQYRNGGFHERLLLIRRLLPDLDEITILRSAKCLNGVEPDDLLDSLVLGLTAGRMDSFICLPEVPQYDSTGLPMRICYSLF